MSLRGKLSQLAAVMIGLMAMCFLTGCLEEKVLVVVKPDGSGKIVFSQKMLEIATEMIKKQSEAMGESEDNDPVLSQTQRTLPQKFGGDATITQKKRVKLSSGLGYVFVLSFDNIDNIRIPLTVLPVSHNTPSAYITFKQTKNNGISKLQVNIPEITPDKDVLAISKKKDIKEHPMSNRDKQQWQQIISEIPTLKGIKVSSKEDMFKVMMAGGSRNIILRLDGTLIKGDLPPLKAPKPEFQLFQLDWDTLLANKGFAYTLGEEKNANAQASQFLSMAKACDKGFSIPAKNKIILEFK